MTGPEYHDELVNHLEGAKALDALRAEIAGLQAQVEDLRQGKTVAALGRVARDANALLRAMSTTSEFRMEPVGFDELRSNLSEALEAFTKEAEADLAAATKRSRELEHGPLADELAAERAAESMTCPKCHGSGNVGGSPEQRPVPAHLTTGPGSPWPTCLRCKGSGRINSFDFGIRPATVARGRDAA